MPVIRTKLNTNFTYSAKSVEFELLDTTPYPDAIMVPASNINTRRTASGMSFDGNFHPDNVRGGEFMSLPIDLTVAGSHTMVLQWPTSYQAIGISLGDPDLGVYVHFQINSGLSGKFRWESTGFNGTASNGSISGSGGYTLPTAVQTSDEVTFVLSWSGGVTPTLSVQYSIVRGATTVQALTQIQTPIAVTSVLPGWTSTKKIFAGYYANTIFASQVVLPLVKSLTIDFSLLSGYSVPTNPVIWAVVSDSNSTLGTLPNGRVFPRAAAIALPFLSGRDANFFPNGQGVSGALAHPTASTTLAWTATNITYLNPNMQARLREAVPSPTALIVMIGTNDAQAGTPTTANQYDTAVRAIVGWYGAPAKILLITPAYFKTNTTANGFLDQYHTKLATLATELGSRATHIDLRSVVNAQNMTDGIHWGNIESEQSVAATAISNGMRTLLGTSYTVDFVVGPGPYEAYGFEEVDLSTATTPSGGSVSVNVLSSSGPGVDFGDPGYISGSNFACCGQAGPGLGTTSVTIRATVFGDTTDLVINIPEVSSGGGSGSGMRRMSRGRK